MPYWSTLLVVVVCAVACGANGTGESAVTGGEGGRGAGSAVPEGGNAGSSGAAPPTAGGSGGAGAGGEDSSGEGGRSEEEQLPPTDAARMRDWLDAGHYLRWHCEERPTSKDSGSSGIHVHRVNRVCTNALLASATLQDGEWPAGVASVKETYDGEQLVAFDVAVKVADRSDGGAGWYWYATPAISGFGVAACTGCHAVAGSSEDFPGPGDFVYWRAPLSP